MSRTIYTIRAKVIKVVNKVNNNISSKYFGKQYAVLECADQNIFVQQLPEVSKETLEIVFDATKIVGKTCVFNCIKVVRNYFLIEIKEIGE